MERERDGEMERGREREMEIEFNEQGTALNINAGVLTQAKQKVFCFYIISIKLLWLRSRDSG